MLDRFEKRLVALIKPFTDELQILVITIDESRHGIPVDIFFEQSLHVSVAEQNLLRNRTNENCHVRLARKASYRSVRMVIQT